MNVLELKGSIIEIVGQLENESFLSSVKDFIESRGENWFRNTGDNGFTPEQIEHLLMVEAECDDPNNMVSHEDAVKEIESWLKR